MILMLMVRIWKKKIFFYNMYVFVYVYYDGVACHCCSFLVPVVVVVVVALLLESSAADNVEQQ